MFAACGSSHALHGKRNRSRQIELFQNFQSGYRIAVKDFLTLDMANYDSGDHGKDCFENPCKYMLYNDPSAACSTISRPKTPKKFIAVTRKIASAGKRAASMRTCSTHSARFARFFR
ncbi:MAG: hypothetical protein ACLUSP_05030 [Christensenellales bacterium]